MLLIERLDTIDSVKEQVLLFRLVSNVMDRLDWNLKFVNSLYDLAIKTLPYHRSFQEQSHEPGKDKGIKVEEYLITQYSRDHLYYMEHMLPLFDRWVNSISARDAPYYSFLFQVYHSVASFIVYPESYLYPQIDETLRNFMTVLDTTLLNITGNSLSTTYTFEYLLNYDSELQEYEDYNWNTVGIALYLWHAQKYHIKFPSCTWIPSVFLKTFLFLKWTSHIVALLENGYYVGVHISICILDWLPLDYLIPEEDRTKINISNNSLGHGVLENIHLWMRHIIDFAVRCPIKSLRANCLQILRRLLKVLDEESKFIMLQVLMKACPYITIISAFVYELKEQILTSLNNLIQHDTHSPFVSKRLFDEILLPYVFKPQDVLERHEVLQTGLNMLIMIAIRDKHTRKFYFWKDKASFKNFLTGPLNTEIVRSIYHEMSESETYEQQTSLLKKIQKEGIPDMTLQKMDQVQKMNILKLQMVHSTLTRLEELLK